MPGRSGRRRPTPRTFPYDARRSPPAPVLPVRVGRPGAEPATAVMALVDSGADVTVLPDGLRGARAVLGPNARPGPQPDGLGGAACFVVPATSGRQATDGRRETFARFRALAAWLEQVAPT